MVKVETKYGIQEGRIVWSNDKGAYVQFEAFAGPHGWYKWEAITKEEK